MPSRQGGQWVKGNVPHHAKARRRSGEEEAAVSAGGAGVGGVSTAAEGEKLDDVNANDLGDARESVRTFDRCTDGVFLKNALFGKYI